LRLMVMGSSVATFTVGVQPAMSRNPVVRTIAVRTVAITAITRACVFETIVCMAASGNQFLTRRSTCRTT